MSSSIPFPYLRMLRRVDVVDFGPLTESATRHLGVFYTGEKPSPLIYTQLQGREVQSVVALNGGEWKHGSD
jgi:hypothetical protein